MYTDEPDGDPPSLAPRKLQGEHVTNANFTVEDIITKLYKLKPDKSPGIDQIHPHVLKECREKIAVPLFIIFKKSMEEGYTPEDWRQARVTPIFKKGSKRQACNYRPVSLTSIPCKIMESLVRDAILKHLLRKQPSLQQTAWVHQRQILHDKPTLHT